MKPAIEQFSDRALRILGEFFPVAAPNPFKFANAANAFTLARTFPTDSFMPSDQMFVTQAKIEIASGTIGETAAWRDAFLEFFRSEAGRCYKIGANTEIFERALAGRCPTVSLLTQIASDFAGQLVMTATATAQAERDQRHEALFHELAPRLIVDIPAGSNRYAVALENKRMEERRQQMWDLPLEELEALKAKKNLRNISKEELRAIVNSNEPNRKQQMIFGDRHSDALPEQIMLLRERGAEEVKAGIFRQIPDEWKIPGKNLTVPFSHNLLAQLPADLTRKLLQMYGNNQLTYMCELTKLKLLQKQQD